MDPEIHGYCDDRFKPVLNAFRQNFAERGEIGACVCIELEGMVVVDLWAGYMDESKSKPWHENTIVNAWSVGKAVAALTLLHLLEAKHISVDEKVSSYWPEFSAKGKDNVTFEMVMSHRAGLCGIESPLPGDAYYHWDLMANAIAEQRPWWEPGTNHGYHTNTFGFLMGEPVRRIAGLSIRDYMTASVSALLESDFHFGVPNARLNDCADLIHMERPDNVPAPSIAVSQSATGEPLSRMRHYIYNNPSLSQFDFNSREWRAAEFPSTSPQSNARASARVFSELAQIAHGKENGIVSRSLLDRATTILSDGEDLNVGRPTRFGLGFQLSQPDRPLGPNPGTFGHYGNGGHLAFADPSIALGFAYHMNHQGFAWRDPRNIALTDAVYESLH